MNNRFSRFKKLIALAGMGVLSCAFVFSSFESRAQEQALPLTNENLLRETIGGVLEDCFKDAPFDSKLIWIEEEGKNPSAWIVKEEIVSYLQKRGPVGLEKEKGMEENDLVLSFRIIRLSLEYPQVKTKKLLGRSWVKRESQVALSFNLCDSQGRVLWSKRGEEKNSDLVRMDELADLNNKQYPYLSPEVPESGWGKYIEPAAVTVVVGALVYLFFANR